MEYDYKDLKSLNLTRNDNLAQSRRRESVHTRGSWVRLVPRFPVIVSAAITFFYVVFFVLLNTLHLTSTQNVFLCHNITTTMICYK